MDRESSQVSSACSTKRGVGGGEMNWDMKISQFALGLHGRSSRAKPEID